MLKDRYYVQHISNQLFLVRERMMESPDTVVNDRLIRSFETRFDAYEYADTMNKKPHPYPAHTD